MAWNFTPRTSSTSTVVHVDQSTDKKKSKVPKRVKKQLAAIDKQFKKEKGKQGKKQKGKSIPSLKISRDGTHRGQHPNSKKAIIEYHSSGGKPSRKVRVRNEIHEATVEKASSHLAGAIIIGLDRLIDIISSRGKLKWENRQRAEMIFELLGLDISTYLLHPDADTGDGHNITIDMGKINELRSNVYEATKQNVSEAIPATVVDIKQVGNQGD